MKDFRYTDTKYVNSNTIKLNTQYKLQIWLNRLISLLIFVVLLGVCVYGYIVYQFDKVYYQEEYFEIPSEIMVGTTIYYSKDKQWYDSVLFNYGLKEVQSAKVTGLPYSIVVINGKMYQLKQTEYSIECTKKDTIQNCILDEKFIYFK